MLACGGGFGKVGTGFPPPPPPPPPPSICGNEIIFLSSHFGREISKGTPDREGTTLGIDLCPTAARESGYTCMDVSA